MLLYIKLCSYNNSEALLNVCQALQSQFDGMTVTKSGPYVTIQQEFPLLKTALRFFKKYDFVIRHFSKMYDDYKVVRLWAVDDDSVTALSQQDEKLVGTVYNGIEKRRNLCKTYHIFYEEDN